MKAQTIFLSLLFCLGFATSLGAQRFGSYTNGSAYNKAVFLELGGDGLLYSINYDMRLQRGRQDGIGFKAGIGGLSANISSDGDSGRAGYFAIPATFNYLLGKKRHALEMGFGATFLHVGAQGEVDNERVSVRGSAVYPHANFGYRYQALNDGLTLRLTLTPLVGIGMYGGVSVGFNFK